MAKSISLLFNNESEILSQFEELKNNKLNELLRLEILRTIWTSTIINYILKELSNIDYHTFTEQILPNIVISGAGMIKIKLLTHPFGKIRLHIWPSDSLPLMWKNLWGNCHIHDFQAYSHVLSWEIYEESFKVYKMTEEENKIYSIFLKRILGLDIIKQEDISNILEWIFIWKETSNHFIDIFCHEFNIKPYMLAQRHTFFTWERYVNTENNPVESFQIHGNYNFELIWKRTILAWEAYFLPIEQWHRIYTNWDTMTFFVTDTSYKHGAIPDNGHTLLNGHGKRYPRKQLLLESRNSDWYNLESNVIYETVKNICKSTLKNLNNL